MICTKNLRFSGCPRAKVGCQGPLGSARAQPWGSVFSGHPAARFASTIMIYIILEMITVNSTTTSQNVYQYIPYYGVANNNFMNLQNSLHLVNSVHCLPASLSILVGNSSFVNHLSLSTTVYFVPDKKETV